MRSGLLTLLLGLLLVGTVAHAEEAAPPGPEREPYRVPEGSAARSLDLPNVHGRRGSDSSTW